MLRDGGLRLGPTERELAGEALLTAEGAQADLRATLQPVAASATAIAASSPTQATSQ
jgi:hypothetical protein